MDFDTCNDNKILGLFSTSLLVSGFKFALFSATTFLHLNKTFQIDQPFLLTPSACPYEVALRRPKNLENNSEEFRNTATCGILGLFLCCTWRKYILGEANLF